MALTSVFPAVTETKAGASGTFGVVTLFDAADACPVPAPLVAVTVQLTVAPGAMPVTTMGDAGPFAFCTPQDAV